MRNNLSLEFSLSPHPHPNPLPILGEGIDHKGKRLQVSQVTHPGIPSLMTNGRRLQLGFTLVELIVVITILAILGTIAFMALQGYSSQSRDSVRISDIGNITKMLELSIVKGEKVPKPENSIEITASGTLIGYQGEAGSSVLNTLGVFNGGKDPLEETYYTYSTNEKLNKYQVLGFLEDGSDVSYQPHPNPLLQEREQGQTQAKDLSKRDIYTKGDELGILLDPVTSEPVQKYGINVDLVNSIEEYNLTFSETNNVVGTGGILFSTMYNSRKDLLVNKENAKLDASLVLYIDMETTTMSGSQVLLKDLSKYRNNGACYNSGTLVDCGSDEGPQIVDGDGKSGKAMSFDGVDDNIRIKNNTSLQISQNITIIALYNWKGNNIKVGFITAKGWENYETHVNGGTTYYGLKYFAKNLCNFTTQINLVFPNIWKGSAFTFNSLGYLNIYSNGENIGKSNCSQGLLVDNQNFLIGSRPNMNYFDGLIDEVRIYNRALSDSEIKTLYEATK